MSKPVPAHRQALRMAHSLPGFFPADKAHFKHDVKEPREGSPARTARVRRFRLTTRRCHVHSMDLHRLTE